MRFWPKVTKERATISAFAVIGALFAILAADRIFPPDLSRTYDRSTVIEDRSGRMLRAYLASDGIWRLATRPEDVDAGYLRLLVAYEDQRFSDHTGIDPLAVARAGWQFLSNLRVVSGASTLTMQAARLLEPGGSGLLRKFAQMTRALQLEARFTKDEILGIYLTLAPFGGNIEGVRAASLIYFGKEPKHLTLSEAALLVALPQSPERLRPDRNPDAALKGRNRVLQVLCERGAISCEDAREAMDDPLRADRGAMPFHAPHLADRLARTAAPGAHVTSTIDRRLQENVERLLSNELQFFRDGANLAAIVVDNETHEVLAYAGGANYWGPAGYVDLARAIRSPGSALKPFIYGFGFDDLVIHPATLIDDAAITFDGYTPRNFDRDYQGTVTIREALQHSLNVPAVQILERTGPVRMAATLRQAGARLELPSAWATPSLPIALGGVGVSLADVVMLYTAIPNGGVAQPLRFLREAANDAPAKRLFGPAAAWYLTDILRGSPLPDEWAMGQGIERARAVAFKTGTSYGYRDAWAIGFSDHYTVGVWAGRADGSTRPGRFGRNESAPVMLKIFDVLPPEDPSADAPPVDVIAAATARDLPPGLQRFQRLAAPVQGIVRAVPPPTIAFPPDGATVEVAASAEERALVLRAEGGTQPLRWIVNGEMLPEPGLYQPTTFTPEGAGFARITVIDAAGRSASAMVRFVFDD